MTKDTRQPLTWVLQKWGNCTNFEHWNTNQHLWLIEHLCFDFPTFAKPKTVSRSKNHKRNEPTHQTAFLRMMQRKAVFL